MLVLRLISLIIMSKEKITVFWFRRDLRFDDNAGLYHALQDQLPVLPLFIFDTEILDDLEDKKDARVEFIYKQVTEIHRQLEEKGSSIMVKKGKPEQVYKEILNEYEVGAVYTNHDYEPYAKERDGAIKKMLEESNIPFHTFKDHVILEKDEVQNNSGSYYKVFTPYKNKWLKQVNEHAFDGYPSALRFDNWHKIDPLPLPSLKAIGFEKTHTKIPSKTIKEDIIDSYDQTRDYPGITGGTSRLGIHLRHGTLSIRKLAKAARSLNDTFLNELIWRDFYIMILDHNPQVVDAAFKPKYDKIQWRNNEEEFEKWCQGKTGFPIVDAGMRQLNASGYMHNRIRMVTASFLTKHLLIDWRWGEAYFAGKLLDYELANNNGGWQWAAGCGTDAQPYFRIFNPYSQAKKYDKNKTYIKEWVPEYDSEEYPEPMVNHEKARERCLKVYKKALGK